MDADSTITGVSNGISIDLFGSSNEDIPSESTIIIASSALNNGNILNANLVDETGYVVLVDNELVGSIDKSILYGANVTGLTIAIASHADFLLYDTGLKEDGTPIEFTREIAADWTFKAKNTEFLELLVEVCGTVFLFPPIHSLGHPR